jgi:hypothetical protein
LLSVVFVLRIRPIVPGEDLGAVVIIAEVLVVDRDLAGRVRLTDRRRLIRRMAPDRIVLIRRQRFAQPVQRIDPRNRQQPPLRIVLILRPLSQALIPSDASSPIKAIDCTLAGSLSKNLSGFPNSAINSTLVRNTFRFLQSFRQLVSEGLHHPMFCKPS